MPTPITGVSQWAAINGPAGGDARSSASVRTMGQGLADRVEYLKNAAWASFFVPLVPFYNANSRFAPLIVAGRGWVQSDVTDEGELIFHVPNVPAFGTIISIRAYVYGGTGRADRPATRPAVALDAINLATGAVASVVPYATDPSADLATYQTPHTWAALSSSGGTYLIDSGSTYWAKFKGEAGANAASSQLSLMGLRIFTDITDVT